MQQAQSEDRAEGKRPCSASTVVAMGLFMLVAGQTTVAQENDGLHPLLTEKVTIDVGIFFPERDVELSVDGTIGGENAEFDFDSQLDLGSSESIFAAEVAWRFGEKWSLLAQYFKSSDTGSAVLTEDIEWGDVVFGEGTGVRGGTEAEIIRLFFSRQVMRSNRHDLGIGAGIHSLDVGAFIDGTIVQNGTPTSARRSVDEWAPLPNIGAWYLYSISPRWAFRSRLDLLSASVGDVKGLLFNGLVGVDYKVFERGGIGLAYSYFLLNVEYNTDSWRGDFQTSFGGPYLYLSGYF